MAIISSEGVGFIMARNEVGLEASLFAELAECGNQRPRTFTKWPVRTGGTFAILHSLPLPFRTHWNGHRDSWCYRATNNCDACHRLQGFKGHFVWAIWDFVRKQHGAIDLNDRAAPQLLEAEIYTESRAGCVYTLKKEGGVENGRIVIAHTGMCVNPAEYGKACDIIALVVKTYGITVDDLDPEFVHELSFLGNSPTPPEMARNSGARRSVEKRASVNNEL
jgi:hypothetical protein